MIKVGLVAPFALNLFERSRIQLLSDAGVEVLPRFTVFFYAYPVYMYFNFSGYTDIVVAAGRLVGLTLPENFDRPYLARNIIDFWNRWHISLTHWIRDYVFMNCYKLSIERFPGPAKQLGYGLLFSSLFLAGGVARGDGGFRDIGAIHGLGAATNRFYGDTLRSWIGRQRYKRYEKDRLIHWLAVLVTVHYVCFSFIFFSSSVQDAARVLSIVGRSLLSGRRPGRPDRSASSPRKSRRSSPRFSWPHGTCDTILSQFDRFGQRVTARTGSLYATVLLKTLFVAFMLISLWGLEKEPEIAYMRFLTVPAPPARGRDWGQFVPTFIILGVMAATAMVLLPPMYFIGKQYDDQRIFLRNYRAPNEYEALIGCCMIYAAESQEDNDVIFVGDSALRFAIRTPQFEQESGLKGYNLGSAGLVALSGYTRILDVYLSSSHPKPRLVVLGLTPTTLNLGDIGYRPQEERDIKSRLLWCYGPGTEDMRPHDSFIYHARVGFKYTYGRLVGGFDCFAVEPIPLLGGATFGSMQQGLARRRGFSERPARSLISTPPSQQVQHSRSVRDL